ncbi:rRNA biogenesis protein rrp36 [Homalodisca vitripennis]|nr:rRNA biogenesis protein rrp36 [Homalodisca vitripennis]
MVNCIGLYAGGVAASPSGQFYLVYGCKLAKLTRADAFKNAYSFIKDIKQKEKEDLYKELKRTHDEDRKGEIKYLIQRIENQEREEARKLKKEEKRKQEREQQIESLRQGKMPKFVKKSEKKVLDLVERYEELKKSGKLKKHIEKRNKKRLKKDRKTLPLDND